MTWVRVDDGFSEHPKVVKAGKLAAMLFVDSLCYSARQLTDGFIPGVLLPRWGYGKGLKRAIQSLIDADLWTESLDGYQIHDYLEYQPSSEQVRNERSEKHAAKVRAGTIGAEKRWQNHSRPIAEPWQEHSPVPSRPIPTRPKDEDVPPVAKATSPKGEPSALKVVKKFSWQTWDEIPVERRDELLVYAKDWFTSTEVKTRIDSALNHKARTKWLDTVKGLKDWLRNDHEWSGQHANNGRSAERNSVATAADDERFARFRNIPEVGAGRA